MERKRKEMKEEDFITLMKIMDGFMQNYMVFEIENYMYPN